MDDLNFYRDLPPFSEFSMITNDECFQKAPESWYIFLTDVAGSTKAIKEGRYKQVNMIGASGIIGIINRLGDFEFPFVFGGDGATLLIPEKYKKEVCEELQSLQGLSENEFQLKLRVGLVQLKDLYKDGHQLTIGKYELSEGNHLAQFKGSALTRAEEMIKGNMPGVEILEASTEEAPRLDGLSCRLSPLKSNNGVIFSLLVQPRINSEKEIILKRVMQQLLKIIDNDFKLVSPVDRGRLHWRFISPYLNDEAILNGRGASGIIKLISKFFISLLQNSMLIFNMKIGDFEAEKYKQEIVLNSDFKKFDETLRMVIDCNLDQVDAIEKFLQGLYEDKEIFYGTFRSKEAIATCMVHSATNNRHVHFIDGADGGYALAAVGLKEQLRQSKGE